MSPFAVLSGTPRTRRILACLVAVAFLTELAAGLTPVRAAPAGSTEIRLHDDDGAAALFGSDGLHPGRIDRACVALSSVGSADPSDEVRLSAEISNDDLAPYLVTTVERGRVGGFGNCSSFTGEELWSGTLADFPVSASSGILTGWRPAVDDRVVYRFTVTVEDDPRAQRRAAAATFVWTLDEAAPAPEPEPEPEPPVASPPTDPIVAEPVSGTDPAPTTPPPSTPPSSAPAPSTPPSKTPPASTPPSGTPSAEVPPDDADDVVEAAPLPVGPSSIAEVVEGVAETALSVARDGHFPVILLTVLVAFLALQGAVDRRDPKLALARLHQDLREFRQFPEPPRTDPP